MPYVQYGDDRLFFTDEGQGTPILFIHGSCGGGGQWRGLSTALSDTYRCICPDNPGTGQSGFTQKNRNWRKTDDGRAFEALLDHLKEPAHLVLHSGGGRFGYSLIRDRQDDLLSLTLFEPVYFHLLRQIDDPLFAEPQNLSDGYRALWQDGKEEEAMRLFVDVWGRQPGLWASLPPPVKAMMRSGAKRLYHEWTGIWEDDPDTEQLSDIQLNTLIFKGSDTIASMHKVTDIIAKQIPSNTVHEIEGAGHMSPFTHWKSVLNVVQNHLAQADPAQ